jgi:hypothetical protein
MTANRVLNINTRIVASQIIDSEAVIINLGNGMIYTMDGVGAEIWRMIGEGRSIQSISDVLSANFDVTGEQALTDVEEIARELFAEELVVEGSSAANGGGLTPVEGSNAPAPYTKPILVKQTDMKDVLALDPPLPKFDDGEASRV